MEVIFPLPRQSPLVIPWLFEPDDRFIRMDEPVLLFYPRFVEGTHTVSKS